MASCAETATSRNSATARTNDLTRRLPCTALVLRLAVVPSPDPSSGLLPFRSSFHPCLRPFLLLCQLPRDATSLSTSPARELESGSQSAAAEALIRPKRPNERLNGLPQSTAIAP